ncbi:MAG: glycoside hydrolase family 25 [Oscillospiraceae bacterium]|nr:glycoside hydrolase family 25 [Oscillospiraceae bacterium]
MNHRRKKWLSVFSLIIIVVVTPLILLFCGIIHINNPDSEKYPIVGVDVSSYQGTIDWKTLASQNIRFAFIKATEGSSFVDSCFEKNWSDASETNLRVGAYHFFSFESPGKTQADLFSSTVTTVDNMLPPVIDVEYYGKYKSEKDISIFDVKNELRILVDRIAASYGMNPIIYASKETYDTIIKGDFNDCDLWMRSVYSEVRSDIDWVFWQYSDRHILNGYSGKERFIDMNVFFGTDDEFASYPK